MMKIKTIGRAALCLGILSVGVVAQAALENLSKIERPPLRQALATLPMQLGDWVGKSQEVDKEILDQSQATEYLSRQYTNPKYPGIALSLWVNYSLYGTNMRHSPEICLPSHGWKKVESMTKALSIPGPEGKDQSVSRLAYAQGELVQGVGFWYYIFGESKIERWVRTLPVTSRSSHGQTTRGSGLTVEVFWNSDGDPDSLVFQDFARAMLEGFDPILPTDRVGYHIP
jgi:hypothetical protein